MSALKLFVTDSALARTKASPQCARHHGPEMVPVVSHCIFFAYSGSSVQLLLQQGVVLRELVPSLLSIVPPGSGDSQGLQLPPSASASSHLWPWTGCGRSGSSSRRRNVSCSAPQPRDTACRHHVLCTTERTSTEELQLYGGGEGSLLARVSASRSR